MTTLIQLIEGEIKNISPERKVTFQPPEGTTIPQVQQCLRGLGVDDCDVQMDNDQCTILFSSSGLFKYSANELLITEVATDFYNHLITNPWKTPFQTTKLPDLGDAYRMVTMARITNRASELIGSGHETLKAVFEDPVVYIGFKSELKNHNEVVAQRKARDGQRMMALLILVLAIMLSVFLLSK